MAATKSTKANLGALFKNGDILIISGMFGTILVMIMPVPAFLLDGCLALSIGLSLLTLLAILYVKCPAVFTGFATLLLCLRRAPDASRKWRRVSPWTRCPANKWPSTRN
jgi:flagellar biosynthesis protein FlhA